jgi:hypothetical protein
VDQGELSVIEYVLALGFGAVIALTMLKVLWDQVLRPRVWSTVSLWLGETIGTA